MKYLFIAGIILVLGVLGFFLFKGRAVEKEPETPVIKPFVATIEKSVVFETTKGKITIAFFPEDAPKTVENFLGLVEKGFYNGLIFHRVISGFMIQGGDPSGNGTGGPGYKFDDEIDPNSVLYKKGYVRGVVAMANSGPNTNGSQFFIMLKDTPLPPNYTIFGEVVKGQDVVSVIGAVPTNASDKPLEPVVMKSVKTEPLYKI